MSVTPVFILSLPRSGSTLLQRLVSVHPGVSTKSEPWIALPVFFALKNSGLTSIYSHKTLATGVNKFVDSLPEGVDDYYACAARYLRDLYTRSTTDGAQYFVDKTPRYHLIVDELLAAFPDARFVFLWRNPLAIAASMIKTYGKGKWGLYMFTVDLYSGIESLTKAYTENKEKVLSVSYESLVTDADNEAARVLSYLDLEGGSNLSGGLKDADIMWGDRTGQFKYQNVSTDSVDSWKDVMSTPYRKAWGKDYLHWIGKDRLEVMGYDMDDLLADIHDTPTQYRYLLSDIVRAVYGKIYSRYCISDIKSNKPYQGGIYYPKN
ncbi:sulfotransferase family protein [Thiohalobacter thiocyanaticus]|uniref:Sulfotransferase n=1 Tax=Thiohalobacter thiocyanaticus TaxID=585455 RepID=A0A426QIT6_9GAMM|nr:sulfotransferase [Thiohalobacter thiocyanaticus]RRQ21650.1 sulfotransferase [Thiohalobacter thiocyanaticus]